MILLVLKTSMPCIHYILLSISTVTKAQVALPRSIGLEARFGTVSEARLQYRTPKSAHIETEDKAGQKRSV